MQRPQPTTLYKVRAHANMIGNGVADTLAKEGTLKEHSNASQPHEFAHSTPYYYQRDECPSMGTTLTKDLVDTLKDMFCKTHTWSLHDECYETIVIWQGNLPIDHMSLM